MRRPRHALEILDAGPPAAAGAESRADLPAHLPHKNSHVACVVRAIVWFIVTRVVWLSTRTARTSSHHHEGMSDSGGNRDHEEGLARTP